MAGIAMNAEHSIGVRDAVERSPDERLGAVVARSGTRMRASAQWATLWVATFTVFAYVVLASDLGKVPHEGIRLAAVLFGILEGILIWAIAAVATNEAVLPARANPRSHSELLFRIATVEADLARLSSSVPTDVRDGFRLRLASLKAHLDCPTPDVDWSFGDAYVIRWRELHALEEAMIEYESDDRLAAILLHDQMRVGDSKLNRKGSIVHDSMVQAKSKLGQPDHELRLLLRQIRTAVDDFRDRRYEALVSGRRMIDEVSVLLGLTAWALLALAILVGATPESIAWVSALYLVGIGAGLLTQLRSSGLTETTADIFGYGRAHLRRTVLLSGLAAVAGVFLATTMGAGASAGLPTQDAKMEYTAQAVLLAAAFGLAPGVLFERLSSWAKSNLDELESTQVAEGRATPPDGGTG